MVHEGHTLITQKVVSVSQCMLTDYACPRGGLIRQWTFYRFSTPICYHPGLHTNLDKPFDSWSIPCRWSHRRESNNRRIIGAITSNHLRCHTVDSSTKSLIRGIQRTKKVVFVRHADWHVAKVNTLLNVDIAINHTHFTGAVVGSFLELRVRKYRCKVWASTVHIGIVVIRLY